MHRSMRRCAIAALPIVCLAGTALPVAAQCVQALTGSQIDLEERFGNALAMSGDRFIAGAYRQPVNGNDDAGAAYVFRSSGLAWTEVGMLTAPAPAPSDRFGWSVAIESHIAVVGAPYASSPSTLHCGMAFVYADVGGNSWQFVTALSAPDGAANDDFGYSVSIADGYIYVAAAADDNERGFNAGAVYVYKQNGAGVWQYTTKLMGSDSVQQDHFGYSVAADNGVLAVSSFYASSNGLNSNGVVYAFSRLADGSFVEQVKLSAPDAYSGATFGAKVAVYDERIAISDYVFPVNGLHWVGKVYLFRRQAGVWAFADDATPTPILANTRFGTSVAMDAGNIAIGGEGISDGGAAAVFSIDSVTGQLTQRARFNDPDHAGYDAFGSGVGISNGRLVVSDPQHSPEDHQDSGNAHVFVLPDPATDNCGTAPELLELFTTIGCTSGAIASGAGPSCGSSASSADVFYTFIPNCTGVYTITTNGSNFDTVLSIHSACPANSANAMACNDDIDGANNRASRITPTVQANQTYIVRVAGYSGAVGTYMLSASGQFIPPANDLCASATVVSLGSHPVNTCGAGTQAGPFTSCSNGQDDVWFRVTAPATGPMTIDVCESNFDPTLDVWAGGCDRIPFAPLACRDDFCGYGPQVEIQAQQGVSYLIRVGSYYGITSGLGTLNIEQPSACPCDWNQSGLLNSQDYFDFLTAFFAGNADYNQSGGTNSQDFFDFLTCFFTGC